MKPVLTRGRMWRGANGPRIATVLDVVLTYTWGNLSSLQRDRGVDETMEMERHRQRSRASTRRRAPESA